MNMFTRLIRALGGGLMIFPLLAGAQVLKINGSTTVNLPAAEAAENLRAEKKMQIQVDTQGGSAGGISMLGDGLVQVGMASKHVSDDDRAKYPQVEFREIHVGEDAVADRIGLAEMTSFVAAVIQSEMLGVSMAKVLRIQSDQMRVKRRQRAEEEAHQAPIKMILPLGLLIFPSIFIILLTPAGIQISKTLGNLK